MDQLLILLASFDVMSVTSMYELPFDDSNVGPSLALLTISNSCASINCSNFSPHASSVSDPYLSDFAFASIDINTRFPLSARTTFSKCFKCVSISSLYWKYAETTKNDVSGPMIGAHTQ